jgi:hypothetical protein
MTTCGSLMSAHNGDPLNLASRHHFHRKAGAMFHPEFTEKAHGPLPEPAIGLVRRIGGQHHVFQRRDAHAPG